MKVYRIIELSNCKTIANVCVESPICAYKNDIDQSNRMNHWPIRDYEKGEMKSS